MMANTRSYSTVSGVTPMLDSVFPNSDDDTDEDRDVDEGLPRQGQEGN